MKAKGKSLQEERRARAKALRQETTGFTQSGAGRKEEMGGDELGRKGKHFLSTVGIH